MATKILCMIPAGEVYNHHSVRWYQHYDVVKNSERYYNTGDMFVHDSSLKLFAYDQYRALTISKYDEENIKEYNKEYKYAFLRGSNYIHPYMSWPEDTIKVLKNLKIPILCFGIGAQAPKGGKEKLELSEETKTVMQIMADKCTTVGVRGQYTAEILNDIGVKNVDIVGCPTLFRANNPNLKITLPPLGHMESVGYTLRREVGGDYTTSVERYYNIQRKIMHELDKKYAITVMAQGETEEKKIFYRLAGSEEKAVQRLKEINWIRGEDDHTLKMYYNQMFFGEGVSDYERLVRKMDMVVGFRLHGNLIALANGTPAIYCNYDSRTREFTDTFGIPSYDIDSDEDFVLEKYYQQELFDKFNKKYREMYQASSHFLSRNNIPHNMASFLRPVEPVSLLSSQ